MAAEDFLDEKFGGSVGLWTWDCCCSGCCLTCVCTAVTVANMPGQDRSNPGGMIGG
jgi:hypothetical protein